MLTLSFLGQMSSELSFFKNDDDDFPALKVIYVFNMKKEVFFETHLIKLKPGLKKSAFSFLTE